MKFLSFFLIPFTFLFDNANYLSTNINQTKTTTSSLLDDSFEPKISFKNSTWRIDGNAFLDIEKATYSISPIDKFEKRQFGHFINFDDKNKFHGYYRAPCGNDCFTHIYGSYKISNHNEIEIIINSITQSNFCANKMSIKNKHMGKFKISKASTNRISFTRI